MASGSGTTRARGWGWSRDNIYIFFFFFFFFFVKIMSESLQMANKQMAKNRNRKVKSKKRTVYTTPSTLGEFTGRRRTHNVAFPFHKPMAIIFARAEYANQFRDPREPKRLPWASEKVRVRDVWLVLHVRKRTLRS